MQFWGERRKRRDSFVLHQPWRPLSETRATRPEALPGLSKALELARKTTLAGLCRYLLLDFFRTVFRLMTS